jgi:hypothetical protein
MGVIRRYLRESITTWLGYSLKARRRVGAQRVRRHGPIVRPTQSASHDPRMTQRDLRLRSGLASPVVWMDGGLRLSAPTIARSAVPTPPSLRCTSPNCDQAKTRRSARAAVSVQTECSRYADALIGRTYVMFVKSTEARTQELQRLCRLFADRMQDGDKQVALGPTWYCPMLRMATIKRTRTLHPASLGSIKGENAARHPFVWPVRHHPPWRKHL